MNKEKYHIEYMLKSVSPAVLWTYIATANGLADWFADTVTVRGKHFTFTWNKAPQEANQTAVRYGVFARFQWTDEEDKKAFFEFRINQVELTGETVLVITDFAWPDEKTDAIELWNKQIASLRRVLGI